MFSAFRDVASARRRLDCIAEFRTSIDLTWRSVESAASGRLSLLRKDTSDFRVSSESRQRLLLSWHGDRARIQKNKRTRRFRQNGLHDLHSEFQMNTHLGPDTLSLTRHQLQLPIPITRGRCSWRVSAYTALRGSSQSTIIMPICANGSISESSESSCS